MLVKEKHSKIVVFYLAKSFTERLETSKFHDSMRSFILFKDFCRCSYLCDNQIIQKAANFIIFYQSKEPATTILGSTEDSSQFLKLTVARQVL